VSSGDRSPSVQKFDGRQLEVWQALRSKAKAKFPFHDWYAGAVSAVAASPQENPDRLAHAANSLREVLEKLPEALETQILGPDRNIFDESRRAMATAFAGAKLEYPVGWTGEITTKLTTALESADRFLELRGSPTRAERTFGGLVKLDPMIGVLPAESQRGKLRVYKQIAKRLEQFTHHRCEADETGFRECLTQTEDLIIDLLAPLTADDQNELLALIAKGAAIDQDDIAQAFRLIERRGANFAFFFENLREPAWLEPLATAGYFREPPGIEQLGDGLVAFPIWWPMIFLRRMAGHVPEHVTEILLKIGDTDNARVQDGIIGIAADLPPECSIRLEGKIREYINQPYHV
jgi:hypothetical protein